MTSALCITYLLRRYNELRSLNPSRCCCVKQCYKNHFGVFGRSPSASSREYSLVPDPGSYRQSYAPTDGNVSSVERPYRPTASRRRRPAITRSVFGLKPSINAQCTKSATPSKPREDCRRSALRNRAGIELQVESCQGQSAGVERQRHAQRGEPRRGRQDGGTVESRPLHPHGSKAVRRPHPSQSCRESQVAMYRSFSPSVSASSSLPSRRCCGCHGRRTVSDFIESDQSSMDAILP
jgi:hypothetical protein